MKKNYILLLMLCSSFTFSQNWGEQIIGQPNRETSNHFGRSVSISGDYAVIGSSGEDNQTGSAHIYKKNNQGQWIHIQKLTAFVGARSEDIFGSVVKIVGDFVFVSSPKDRLNEEAHQIPAGSVFVYKNDGDDNFVGLQRIRASDAAHSDNFGCSLDANDHYLVVGAESEDHDENNQNQLYNSGSVYIFEKDADDNWNEVQKIVPNHRRSYDNFGTNVAINGNTIIVGSEHDYDENNVNSLHNNGSVFVFEQNNEGTWIEIQKLKASDGTQSSLFGYSGIDISESHIAIAATGVYDDANFRTGSIYIFEKLNGSWSQTNKLFSEIEYSGEMGLSVKIHKNYLMGTLPNLFHGNQNNAGGAVLFYRTGNDWSTGIKITTSNPELNAKVGGGTNNNQGEDYTNFSLDLNGSNFIIGAQLKNVIVDDNEIFDVGEAYISGDIHSFIQSLSIDRQDYNSVNIYPNPIQEKISITIPNSLEDAKLTIYSILGKKLIEKEISNMTNPKFSFPYPKGIYLAKIEIGNKFLKTIKLIKN